MPMARHQPVEPSARATSSITRRVVRMSAPRPPSASEIATLNSFALAISSTRSRGSCRAASISSARSRMRGASARATSSGLVAARAESVIMRSGSAPLERALDLELHDAFHAGAEGRPAARPRRRLDRLQQLPLRGAVLDGRAHVGDDAVLSPAKRQDPDDDHLAVLDRELLAFADRQRAHRLPRGGVLRVFARQPVRPRISVRARAHSLPPSFKRITSAPLEERPGFAGPLRMLGGVGGYFGA